MDKWRKKECKRNEIIKNALDAADKIILDGSDGSVEETNYLTAMVAQRFTERALCPFTAILLAKDIKDSKNN